MNTIVHGRVAKRGDSRCKLPGPKRAAGAQRNVDKVGNLAEQLVIRVVGEARRVWKRALVSLNCIIDQCLDRRNLKLAFVAAQTLSIQIIEWFVDIRGCRWLAMNVEAS